MLEAEDVPELAWFVGAWARFRGSLSLACTFSFLSRAPDPGRRDSIV
jgi:hypothetical protein